ncbi:MAG TPA: outer membrane beta-barrel protein [Bacteroidales bacterium]|nr:outer membrane beta-barrel protein [Bacteroidales bacterium]HRT84286.1 outer membrane beta-barrel protein [Bacteroidales bacterium]
MQNIDFDKRIREMMETHEETPPFDGWERINSALERKRAKIIHFRRGIYIASAVAASLLLLLVINRNAPQKPGDIIKPQLFSERGRGSAQASNKAQTEQVSKNIACVQISKSIERTLSATSEANAPGEKSVVPDEKSVALDEKSVVTDEKSVETRDKSIANNSTKPVKPYNFDEWLNSEDEKKSFRKWLSDRKYKYALSTNISSSYYKKSINLVSVSLGYQNDFVPSSLQELVRSHYVSDIRYAMPVSFGIQFQTDIDKKFSLGSGLVYTLLSSNYQEISETYSRDVNQSLHYIGLPVNGYYNLFENRSVKLYLVAGVMLEKGIAASYKESTDGVKKYHTESISGMQFSAGGGVGIEWKIAKDLGIYFDPSMSYFFKGKQPSSIRTAQPLQYKFEMGMRFEI